MPVYCNYKYTYYDKFHMAAFIIIYINMCVCVCEISSVLYLV
jgi:hypothetical protein